MLDPDEVAAYEDWRARKLTGAQDLSIGAYNAEMAALALAYDEGAKAMSDGGIIRQSLEEVKAKNPYRAPGMRAHNPNAARSITSTEGEPA